jgi:UDP-N-acetylglucosamine:LPS N-acetylglucosamine transferase
VICRAGAITVSELTAAGVASVLVPLVASTTSHQRDNAQWMAKQGAAIHLPQTEMSAASLSALLASLTRDAASGWRRRHWQQASATPTRRSHTYWKNWHEVSSVKHK